LRISEWSELEMTKGFIIEEVRVTGGTMRLRDSRTGNVVEVPLTVGATLTLPEEDEADADDTEEDATDDEDADAADEDAADDAAEEEAKPRKRRRKKRRARKAEAPREAKVEDAPALAVPHSRGVTEDPTPVVDASTLSDEDKAAVEQFRALVSKASARGKRGGLGWQEITVDGRSGLQARWGKGQFKILHTGGDSHALFYEWDGGKWERIACGKADDLMRLAAARSEEEQPKAPLTTLTLEVARLFCGTPDQKEAASERLRPVRTPAPPERAARAPRKAKAEPPAEDAPRPPAGDTPSEIEVSEIEVKDKELMSSFATELENVLAEEDD
jgi:hypothetical protein